jgi:hypothetical protein
MSLILSFNFPSLFIIECFLSRQRGLAESMAKELHPQNVHVCWINIDGVIRNPGIIEPPDRPDSFLDPNSIAETYWNIIQQDRSTWTNEISLRPWVERW